ncbi:MAG TPA: RbsD/FucU domain-containing protein [Burkholderiaceae bacterium]|nr:RbsD/FucU domain-containing protein [Burkholderiaceae bacterium]
MLKNIDPLLTPDLLKALAEMGHDDAVVLADANFTATSLAARPVIHLPAVGLLRAVQAVASIFPIALDEPHPVGFMQVSDTPAGTTTQLQRDVIDFLATLGLRRDQCEAVERFAFYERTRSAYVIVQTGEMQPYGNFLLRKGVIAEALRR